MSNLLTGFENEAVEGVCHVGKLLDGSIESATYQTQYGEPGKPAVIEIRPAGTPTAERRLARWREAMEFAHPNLIKPLSTGSSQLGGLPVIYLVTERADESLAGVLAERPISEKEAREMLQPTLAALSYLHNRGYSQASLTPSNILAVEDSLKLSIGDVERTAEAGSPADDMWSLGLVLVEALTRGVPKVGEDLRPYIIEIPESLRGIARHCLDPNPETRWTTEQALARLNGEANPLPPAVPENRPIQEDRRVQETRQIQEDRQRATPLMAVPRSLAAEPDADVSQGNRSKWIYGGAAALLLIAVAVGFTRKTDRAPAPSPAAVETEKAPLPTPPLREPEVSSSVVAPPAPPAEKKKAAHDARGRRANGWAVVSASYSARGPAEKRAREMRKKWPKFKAEVFEAVSEQTHYVVVLGNNLSEDKAEALRKRAVASGLPRDTYIKRLAPELRGER